MRDPRQRGSEESETFKVMLQVMGSRMVVVLHTRRDDRSERNGADAVTKIAPRGA